MTRGIGARVDRLETRRGADATERWLRSLTDEQLEAEAARVSAQGRDVLAAHGVDAARMSGQELVAALQVVEAAEAAGAALK